MAFIKRVGCLGSNHFCKLPAGNFSPSSLASRFHYRELSKLVKSNGNPVDTLALMRGLEAEGVPSKQAEAVTDAITSLENASQPFVSKAEMQKLREHQLGTEKLRSDIEKMSRELRYEINNLTKLRLDLNRESRRICDELANQHAEKTNLMNKLDRDIHAIGAQWEAAKYVVRTYCIGAVVLLSAVGFVVICI